MEKKQASSLNKAQGKPKNEAKNLNSKKNSKHVIFKSVVDAISNGKSK